jgi:uncharacterized membrane protein
MYCSNCGNPIPPGNSFCPNCGFSMTEPFDHVVFKERARNVLRQKYWPAFLVSLIEAVLVGGLNIYNRFSSNGPSYSHSYSDPGYFLHPSFIGLLMGIFSLVWILGTAYTFFVANPVQVGSSRYFISAQMGRGDISEIFYSFKSGRYLKIVGAMAWQALFIFLWSLLLIIPGIVKAYAYCLVPYIMAENPDIGYKEALKLSMQMTDGYKGDIFYLQLTFIGWFLLGVLCLGVGVLFVRPYFNAAMAEMYASLRNNAIRQGIFPTPPNA